VFVKTLDLPACVIATVSFLNDLENWGWTSTYIKMGEYPLSKIGVLCYEYSSIIIEGQSPLSPLW
jgi:hypothetical protein